MKSTIKQNYKKYQRRKLDAKNTSGFLRSFMPEIIFRTTKLEGEPVTKKMVKSIFR